MAEKIIVGWLGGLDVVKRINFCCWEDFHSRTGCCYNGGEREGEGKIVVAHPPRLPMTGLSRNRPPRLTMAWEGNGRRGWKVKMVTWSTTTTTTTTIKM